MGKPFCYPILFILCLEVFFCFESAFPYFIGRELITLSYLVSIKISWSNLIPEVNLAFWHKYVVTHRNAALDWCLRWGSLNADAAGSTEIWILCGTENSRDIHGILDTSAIFQMLMQCSYSFFYRLLQLLKKLKTFHFQQITSDKKLESYLRCTWR